MADNAVLIADIGGTNARFAIATNDDRHFELAQTLECADFRSVELAIDTYLHSHKIPKISALSLAVAGPVINETVTFPNSHWQISSDDLRTRYDTTHAWLLNDWEAIAYSLVDLASSDVLALESEAYTPKADNKRFTYGALGPGSGLGVAGLYSKDGEFHPLVTEGGHVGFAPESNLQLKILKFLHTKFDDRVSRERLLSGPGLVNVHEALCEIHKTENPGLIAADIAVAGIARTDAICAETMDVFFQVLGQVAGDIALDMGAVDGIFIGGGIAQRYPEHLAKSQFRAGFENKGRHRHLMEKIPTHLITHKNPGLIGASVYANKHLKEFSETSQTKIMRYTISIDPLKDGQVITLLEEHRAAMFSFSPPESIHALEPEALRAPEISLWSARNSKNDQVMGCIALMALKDTTEKGKALKKGELKSMKVSDKYLRMGLGKALLMTLLEHAEQNQYDRLFLETGTDPYFVPALRLYEAHGFTEVGPFGSYTLDPYSAFYSKNLTQSLN